jgi:dihydrofolate reductase
MLSIIVAYDRNQVIGYKNDLPWKLPNDLKYFKTKTLGKTVIMGRKTYESMGGPLKQRENIILTSKHDYYPEGVIVVHSFDEISKWIKNHEGTEIFMIGGRSLFEFALPFAERLYITKIEQAFLGDTYFPEWDETNWSLVEETVGEKNEKNPFDYSFQIFDKKDRE